MQYNSKMNNNQYEEAHFVIGVWEEMYGWPSFQGELVDDKLPIVVGPLEQLILESMMEKIFGSCVLPSFEPVVGYEAYYVGWHVIRG